VQDLNVNPKLPFEDNTFDVITNVVCCSHVVFGLKDGPSFLAIRR
jgi:SAM-dependent methyltransferase